MTTNSLKKRNGTRVGAKSDINPGAELIAFARSQRFATVLADPPERVNDFETAGV